MEKQHRTALLAFTYMMGTTVPRQLVPADACHSHADRDGVPQEELCQQRIDLTTKLILVTTAEILPALWVVVLGQVASQKAAARMGGWSAWQRRHLARARRCRYRCTRSLTEQGPESPRSSAGG